MIRARERERNRITEVAKLARGGPLLWTAILVGLIKALQFAVDSTALFYYDSGSMILNALGWDFLPHRSYFYGWLIRYFVLPFHSTRALVAMQVIMGGLIAWLLAFSLIRYFRARPWVAIGVALVFCIDPVQVVHEHMVLTETSALLAATVYLIGSFDYLEKPAHPKLVLLAIVGMVVAGMRLVYAPVVFATGILLPLIAYRKPEKRLALALAVSCGSTVLAQSGYQHLTGYLAAREPAYHFSTGFFLVAIAAPVIRPDDIDDPLVAEAIAEHHRSGVHLGNPDQREAHLWGPLSLANRLIGKFGDQKAANRAAANLAARAIARDPLGFFLLGVRTYFLHWQLLPKLRWILPWENGSPGRNEVHDHELPAIRSAFGPDAAQSYLQQTPVRRYHIRTRYWYVLLLLAPYLAGLAVCFTRDNRAAAGFLFAWSGLLLASTCIGGLSYCYRYLHPFSFIALTALPVLFNSLLVRESHRQSASTTQPSTARRRFPDPGGLARNG